VGGPHHGEGAKETANVNAEGRLGKWETHGKDKNDEIEPPKKVFDYQRFLRDGG